MTAMIRKTKTRSTGSRAFKRFLRHRLAMVGVAIMAVLTLLAVFAPVIAPYKPEQIDLLNRNQPPNLRHWLGTDQTGRDVFSRTIYAGRVSLLVGVAAVAISLLIGTTLGALAGYFGGITDGLIMRFVDMVMTFPSIIVLLALAAIIGPGLDKTIFIIGLLNWPLVCRLVRAKLLSLREQDFVSAAVAMGARPSRIILRHLLPNTVDVLVVYATLGVASAILLEAGLSFLGLGVQPPTATWGNLINVARNVSILEQYPWQWMPAGAAIVLAVLAINFIGDGLRDALDPRMPS
ncbi:oligopeptide ABC transporter permease [Calidithermus timidus]|uniref:oligopeptide ABC transporter permease n=1 Tax=Calidithermus timidus TaxID=307124 RepID=UPI0003A3542D|nr:oligopeptide ABC transporter permease [Calidithermus timidus]